MSMNKGSLCRLLFILLLPPHPLFFVIPEFPFFLLLLSPLLYINSSCSSFFLSLSPLFFLSFSFLFLYISPFPVLFFPSSFLPVFFLPLPCHFFFFVGFLYLSFFLIPSCSISSHLWPISPSSVCLPSCSSPLLLFTFPPLPFFFPSSLPHALVPSSPLLSPADLEGDERSDGVRVTED